MSVRVDPAANVPSERIGVLMVNFGEPKDPTLADVETYLERIFLSNTDLEDNDEAARFRARQLAQRRAPGLLREYRDIGGSPLNAQADLHAEVLAQHLHENGWDANVYSAFQFTSPGIPEKVAEAKEDGVQILVVLPGYPICGRSTSVAAVASAREAMNNLVWKPQFVGTTGWHYHPEYVRLRADNIRAFGNQRGLDLNDPETLLYFSAHGTPIRYLDAGNRYDRYVEEHCRAVSSEVNAVRYAVGFQNHAGRGIPWTQPDNEDEIRRTEAKRLVVVPISFMHEQSETLAELDSDLRQFAEDLGKEFHRVPVPYEDPRFPHVLGDLVARLVGIGSGDRSCLSPCRCSGDSGVWCTNGNRDLPPSPYVPQHSTA